LGRKVRIPGTLNHKYLDGAKPVRILPTVGRVYSAADFEALPEVPVFLTEHFDDSFIENPPNATSVRVGWLVSSCWKSSRTPSQ
jgi:hypothetical protein